VFRFVSRFARSLILFYLQPAVGPPAGGSLSWNKKMKIKKKLLCCCIVILLVLFIGLGGYFLVGHYFRVKTNQLPTEKSPDKQALDVSQVTIENVEFSVELAKTPEERERGLSNRSKLCDQCGMLFIFENDDYHSFWMKDTLIPLDIIWLDKDWRVVDFVGFIQPQGTRTDKELPIYQPQKLARYVLELPGGTVKKIRGFKIGSQVKINNE